MTLDLWLVGGGIFLLLVFSAFFSSAETAFTAASRARLHQLESEGDGRAATVNRLRSRMDRLIGAILIGNNLVNIMASALATGLLVAAFGDAGVIYATLLMTALVVIFAEVIPKVYAITHADRYALFAVPILRPVVMLLSPLAIGVSGLSKLVLRLVGTEVGRAPFDLAGKQAEEELRGAISLHAATDSGEIQHERDMLRSILDLSEVHVSEIMTHRRNVTAIDSAQDAESIVDQVLESPYTRIPLWRDDSDNIVGVLHAKALLRALRAAGGNASQLDVSAIAVTPWFIPETTDLLEQLHAFRDRKEHFALVVDEYGALLGIVTLEDILEEIVGEISDEHDIAVEGVRQEATGSYLVDGTVTIRDLNRQFEWDLPDEPAATIAGLVLNEARTIPDVGQVFEFHGYRFEIMRRKRNQIAMLRVRPPRTDTD
ncbi:MAG: HlyC/CorC family transporter [Alphaproteobacteria bacterium]